VIALDPATLARMVDDARGHGHAPTRPHGPPKARTVVRFDRDEVGRLDALRARLGGASRAAVARALVRWGLDASKDGAP
jgi:hypothetical protein